MRFTPFIAGACLLLLILYLTLYYYELAAPSWGNLEDSSTNNEYFASPHMREARKSHFLPQIPCGSGWQEEYGAFHHKTLEEDGKVLVSIAVEGGIADNLSGLMSEFYLALLSQRALQIYDYGYLPKYEPAFQYVNFNWSNPGTYTDAQTDNLKYTYNGERGWLGDRMYPYTSGQVDTNVNWCIYQMNDYYNEKDKMFGELDLTRDVPANRTYVKNLFMMSNRGMTYRLGHNPNHNETFARMGLRPEFMFGCAFRAMFKPTEALIRRNEQYFNVLTDPNTKKIGIMVRTGDGSFAENKISDEFFRHFSDYFQCAEEIEAMMIRRNTTQPIIWYLLSDSLDFRRRAKIKYGSRVLTDVETNFIHPDCMAHEPERCSYYLTDVAILQAAGQMMTFAWTDYQVISRYSGFGRVGAVLGAGENHIYSLPRDQFGPCDETHYDTWQQISNDWAGI